MRFQNLLLFLLLVQLHTITFILSLTHHRLRHKHWSLEGRQMNEIRDAFYEYRKTIVRRPIEVQSPDEPKQQMMESSEWTDMLRKRHNEHELTQHGITHHAKNDEHFMVRHKRVHKSTTRAPPTTTTTTTIDQNVKDYDEEYDDDDDDNVTNLRVNDDGDIRIRSQRERLKQLPQEQPSADESLTDHKMKTLGTRQGVEISFRKEMLNHRSSHEKVLENIRRTKQDGACRWPTKRVIEMPQHPSKVYTPRKYVVYRCSDDTACCGSTDKTCVPKRSEEVHLWFYVRHVNFTVPEMVKVRNDTECQCLPKNILRTTTTQRTTTEAPCRCPSNFEARLDSDASCECICRELECRQRAEGREGFNISDQRCIFYKDCTQPNCQHGSYQSSIGRCPERLDKINRTFSRG